MKDQVEVEEQAIEVPVEKTAAKKIHKKKAAAKKIPAKSAPAKKAAARKKPAAKKALKAKPKAAERASSAPSGKRTFPHYSLEEARRIPEIIKSLNAGNPWAPKEIASALEMGMSSNYFYLTTSSRDYGLTVGTRDTSAIELTELGRRLVYPKSSQEAAEATVLAFSNVELFKKVYDYYQGKNLPEIQYLKNTLKTVFGVDEKFQDDFYALYQKNLSFIDGSIVGKSGRALLDNSIPESGSGSIIVGESSGASELVAFIAMPFSEKTDAYAKGYFDEVLKHLITPAAAKANFNSRTANKSGSEVIQSTIINELDKADLVIVDLTEHNPNVLFELGMRIAFNKPVCLIRAEGTKPIFDVDHMLRVYTYNPNLWGSTLAKDVPGLTAHIVETWKGKGSKSYLDILRHNQSE